MNSKSELEKLRERLKAEEWLRQPKRVCRGACFCTGWCQGKDKPNDPPTFTGVDQMRNVIGD